MTTRNNKFTGAMISLVLTLLFSLNIFGNNPAGRFTSVLSSAASGFVVIKSDPSGAQVFINGNDTGKKTPFQLQLEAGNYTFSLQLAEYREYKGSFTITDGQTTTKEAKLVAAYGSIDITSEPSGAMISLDGKATGKSTPNKLEKVPSGIHTISLSRDMYSDASQRVEVSDERISKVFLELAAGYGTIGIVAKPEASIYIDGNALATSSYAGRLSPGLHLIEIKKDRYYIQRKEIKIASGEEMTLNFELDPMVGSISVMCEPVEAGIDINGNYHGISPKIISGLMIGDYNLKLSKTGFIDLELPVKVTENQITNITAQLIPGYNLKISSSPVNSAIYINGIQRGTAPRDFFLAEGDLSVEVKSNYYVDNLKKISLRGDTSLFFRLEPKTDLIKINSYPRNADIYFNSKYAGLTPLESKLPQGNASVVFRKNGYRTTQYSYLLDGTKKEIKENLTRYRSVEFAFLANLILPYNGVFYIDADKEFNPEGQDGYGYAFLLGLMTHGLTIGGAIAGATMDEDRGAGWTMFGLGVLCEIGSVAMIIGESKRYKSWITDRESKFNLAR